MKIITYIFIFLIFGSFLIQLNYEYNLKEKTDQRNFVFRFGKWVSTLFGNVKSLTGYAIRMDWLPEDTNVTDAVDKVLNNTNNTEKNSNITQQNNVTTQPKQNNEEEPKVIYIN